MSGAVLSAPPLPTPSLGFGAPPPALPLPPLELSGGPPLLNGNHSPAVPTVNDALRLGGDLLPPVANAGLSSIADLEDDGLALEEPSPLAPVAGGHSTSIVIAAFLTGILVGVIFTLMFL
jgi:hypothetical protein